MDEQKLKVILEAEIDDAIGYVETETVEQRTKAINYYNRYEYGNEIDGRSKIVTGEVAEVVDGALPQLMRIFTGSDELGRFEPRMPGDEEFAKQATELTNYVFFNDNDGASALALDPVGRFKNKHIRAWSITILRNKWLLGLLSLLGWIPARTRVIC